MNKKIMLIQNEILFALAIFIFFAFVPIYSSRYTIYINSQILITILFSTSLNLLAGYAGLFSFGHVAYFAIGAYTFVILTKSFHISFALSFIIGPVFAAFLAAISGYFCVRLTKIYFTFLTLAFAQIVWSVAFKWTSVTGGDSGIIGVTPPAFLDSSNSTYYFILIIVGLMVFLMYKITHSPFGLMLNTIRENPNRAEFIGINVKLFQLIIFIIAGFFAGISGGLFIILNHSIFPDVILVNRSIELMVMVILGGMYSFWGPAIGAIILIYLNDYVKAHAEYWPLILGIIMGGVILFFPEGITGILRKLYSKIVQLSFVKPEKGEI